MRSSAVYRLPSAVYEAGLAIAALLVLAALADGIVLLRMPVDAWRVGAVLAGLSLLLGAFVGLTDSHLIKELRRWSAGSMPAALGLPFLLVLPYLIAAFGTGTFSAPAFARLLAYIAVPTALLVPDRLRHAARAGWRDFAAMAALGLPIGAHSLAGIWTWPQELYFFTPLTAVCLGAYAFTVLRNLEDVGYRLIPRRGDWVTGLASFVAFALLGIPLGYALDFIRFHQQPVSLPEFGGQLLGTYLTVAIPEELLFRGILQNLLIKSIRSERRGVYGLLIASVVFGASHLHHAPVPNWRYGIMATLAGILYGSAYQTRRRLPACALTHALVDVTWHFWF